MAPYNYIVVSYDICQYLFSTFFYFFCRKCIMEELKGWTLEGLAKKLKMSKNSTQKRIEREKIEPFFTGSIYPPNTYEQIKDAKRGRPSKELPKSKKP